MKVRFYIVILSFFLCYSRTNADSNMNIVVSLVPGATLTTELINWFLERGRLPSSIREPRAFCSKIEPATVARSSNVSSPKFLPPDADETDSRNSVVGPD